MSVNLYRNCPNCGQPYVVREETHEQVVVMNGMEVRECIVCETHLPEAEAVETMKPPTFATTKEFK
jgi:predicted RNA-binding Zn-ribbon protein involved in translation (DUF1610 family)